MTLHDMTLQEEVHDEPQEATKHRRMRKCTFGAWKSGKRVKVRFCHAETFQAPKTHELLHESRIVGVDTESMRATEGGKLLTVMTPIHFHDTGTVIETRDGKDMLPRLFETLAERFSVPTPKDSAIKQRKKEERTKRGGIKDGRDGRRTKIDPALLVFFNLRYDKDRLFADRRHLLKAIAAGADSYKMVVDSRWSIEVVRMFFGSASGFEWFVYDHRDNRVMRLLGLDLVGYWKSSLAAAASSVGVTAKVDIEAQLENAYERPLDRFSEAEWSTMREYALGDVKTTLELYHATARLLTTIDARVVRKSGMIPPSAPSAAAKILFSRAFDLHPELAEWERYPAWVDQMGLDALAAGRAFCARPGIYQGVQVVDLKSAYPSVMVQLPDLVNVQITNVTAHEGFDLEHFKGAWGVLVVDGESLDDVYPPLRIHDEDHTRLRYVFGKFHKRAFTVPELVVGVASGALRINRVHHGVLLEGSADRSFFREGIRHFFNIKEDMDRERALRDLAKLLMNSSFGKLLEIRDGHFLLADLLPMPSFLAHERVGKSIVSLYASGVPDPAAQKDWYDSHSIYWGATTARQADSQTFFVRAMRAFRPNDGEEWIVYGINAYIQALAHAGVPSKGVTTVARYVTELRSYESGPYFFPMMGAMITGLTSARLGVMSRELQALQGDTDSAHFVLPKNVARVEDHPGWSRYFAIMRAAGYPSPRQVDGQWQDALEGLEPLGSWAMESPGPSVESVLVAPKVYSHRFIDPTTGEETFKQAHHAIARYTCVEAELARHDTTLTPAERTKKANLAMQRSLHNALAQQLRTRKDFEYVRRASPRKLAEAIIRDLEPGEFVRKTQRVPVRPLDPNTWRDSHGTTRWHPLSFRAAPRAPTPLTDGQEAAAE